MLLQWQKLFRSLVRHKRTVLSKVKLAHARKAEGHSPFTLVRVPAHVLLQRCGLREGLIAPVTPERSMTSMCLEMTQNLLLATQRSFTMTITTLPKTLVRVLA